MSMELLFVVLLATCLSLAVRYIFRARETFGEAMFPAVGAAVAAVVWAGLTWLGWPFDGGWIWVVSLIAGPVVCVLIGLFLPKRRKKADAAMLDSLSKA
ncbi:hypothetical protein ACX3O0_08860 [Homoserinimonas sp. A447]